MPDKKQQEKQEKEVKELTVDDLEDVAGGAAEGIEIGENETGSRARDVKINEEF